MDSESTFEDSLSKPKTIFAHCVGWRCWDLMKGDELLRELFPDLANVFDAHQNWFNHRGYGDIEGYKTIKTSTVVDGIGEVKVHLTRCFARFGKNPWLRDAQQCDSSGLSCCGNGFLVVGKRMIPLYPTYELGVEGIRQQTILAILQHQLIGLHGEALKDEEKARIEKISSVEELQDAIRRKLERV